MGGRKQNGLSPCARTLLAIACIALGLPMLRSVAVAQTEASAGFRLTDDMRARLHKPGDLTLREATFVEAMFAIRRVWGVNIVVDSNELKEEKVSCDFEETELHEILDTILAPRGYGYKAVGKSLVVRKQDKGADIPLFESITLKVLYADPKEVKEAVSLYLSERGQIQVVESAKRLIVVDYPDRLEKITDKVNDLDEAARDVASHGGGLTPAERLAIERGTAAAGAGNAAGGAGGPNVAVNPTAGTSMSGSGFPGANNKAAFFDLKHTKAELVMPTLQPLLSPVGKLSALPKDNRLIAVDAPERLLLIADAIKELDVPRSQVRISALIYDASLEDIRRLGINWSRTGFHGKNVNPLGVAQDTAVLDAFSAAPAAGAANGAISLASLGSSFDISAILQALAQSKQSRLLADPAVTVYDMEDAKIAIVTEIPYQQLTQGSNGTNIGTTAFREAGVSLIVTPQIAADQTITMSINPKFSLLTGFTPGTNQPIIDKRETTTTVRIRNRETLVIGGLRQKNSINSRNGVPGLMNLHWPIGDLFKVKDVDAKDSELVVFITPETLDVGCLGLPREHDIYNAAVPTLDCIPAPQLPLPPCELEVWKHRCGCKKCKKGGHNGPCQNCPPDMPPPTMYEPRVIQEQLPAVSPMPSASEPTDFVPSPSARRPDPLPAPHPAPSQSSSVAPIEPEERSEVRHPNLETQSSPQESSVPRLKPVQVESAANKPKPQPKETNPATQGPQTEVAAAPPPAPRMKRLPPTEEETPQMARRLTPRDIFKPLPPIENTKLR
jgi:general secretion pathway protein D